MKLRATHLRALFVCLAFSAAQPRSICSQERTTVDALVAALAQQIEAGKPTTKTTRQLESFGMSAAIACARHLGEEKPRTNRILFRLISRVGSARRTPQQLLRLYDPVAHKTFYSESSAESQQQIAACLSWRTLPSEAYEALVKAAPVPLLGWLLEEAKSDTPRHDRIRKALGYWGWWVKAGHEQQFKDEVRTLAADLSANPKIIQDPATFARLLQFAEQTELPDSSELILKGLSHEMAEVRLSAALAIRGDIGRRVEAAYLKALETEQVASVQVSLVRSAANFPEDVEVGRAVSGLYDRSDDLQVRVAILQTLNRARWPQRDALLLKGLDDSQQEIRQSAIQSIPEKPDKSVSSKCFSLARDAVQPDPFLIDALGRLKAQKAAPSLVRWLSNENALMRVRTVLALEKIGGTATQSALLKQFFKERQEIVLSQLVRICSWSSLPGAEGRLVELSTDTHQKFHLRLEAIWALGAYDLPDVRTFLREKMKALESLEDDSDQASDLISDRTDQSEAFLIMSLYRLNDPGSSEEVVRVFDASTPGTKVSMLFMLTELKRDHPIIEKALMSSDYAVLRGGVAAAREAVPSKYKTRLKELSENPALRTILASGLETLGLKELLDESLNVTKGRQP